MNLYQKESIPQKIKKFIRKTMFMFFLFFLGAIGGFYFLVSGGLNTPYTYFHRIINDTPVTSTYKFSPILKEEKSHSKGITK